MAEEIQNQEQENQEQIQDQAYQNLLEQFNKLKDTMVPKEKFDQVSNRNKQLSEAIANNMQEQEEARKQEEPKPDVSQLRAELYGDKRSDMTNLDYIRKSLELRDAVIESGGRDPFLPTGGNDKDSLEAHNTANKVANGLKQLVEQANGDPVAFNALYQANVEEVAIPGRNNRNYRR